MKRTLTRLGAAIGISLVALMGGAVVGLSVTLSRLPSVAELEQYEPNLTTVLLDRNGEEIAQLHDEENRTLVPLKDIPSHMQEALIAMEDNRFYQHPGVDVVGIARAAMRNVKEKGAIKEGASTLTQQLARNLFLTPEQTLGRKVAEAWLSLQIERHYPKNRILEMYLNQVYWGHNAYGVEAASQTYFGKPAKALKVEEAALLAGILSGPEIYSPYRNPKWAKQRQELALDRMVDNGYLTRDEAKKYKSLPLKFSGIKPFFHQAPYFVEYVLTQLNERFGVNRVKKGGLRVVTTIDMKAQRHAEKVVKEEVARLKNYNVSQGALVSVEAKTGAILAMVGGVDYQKSVFNRATQALRQPGSSFKPFVYLTAFLNGMTPNTTVFDGPTEWKEGSFVWKPKNSGGGHSGWITLRSAMVGSVNIAAIKTLEAVTAKKVIETAQKAGIKSNLRENLSLALGTSEVTVLEMAGAYATLASEGLRIEPECILRVEDRKGRLIEERRPEPERVFPEQPVRALIDVMRGVVLHGTGYAANFGRPAAGKTGTTSDHRDAWFAGFTPQLATVVWVGNDDNSRMYHIFGGDICAPIWRRFMSEVSKEMPVAQFTPPDWRELKGTVASIGKGKNSRDGKWDEVDEKNPRSRRSAEPIMPAGIQPSPLVRFADPRDNVPPPGWAFDEPVTRPSVEAPPIDPPTGRPPVVPPVDRPVDRPADPPVERTLPPVERPVERPPTNPELRPAAKPSPIVIELAP